MLLVWPQPRSATAALTAAESSPNDQEGLSPILLGPWVRFKVPSAKGPAPAEKQGQEHGRYVQPNQEYCLPKPMDNRIATVQWPQQTLCLLGCLASWVGVGPSPPSTTSDFRFRNTEA